MMLLSNWDGKDARDGAESNTAVFLKPASQPPTYLYSFTDWGSSLGSWGGFFKRDKWDAPGYARQTRVFVKGVENGKVLWGYSGKHSEDVSAGIRISDVQWLLPYLSRITDEQMRSGFLASGATPAAAESFTRSIQDRIAQLRRACEMAAEK
jgi:hypothetical protein